MNLELGVNRFGALFFLCLCSSRVQELMSGEQRETGRIPRTMECHLTSDLCDSCVPGDTVAVTAIVRVANESTDIVKKKKKNDVASRLAGEVLRLD